MNSQWYAVCYSLTDYWSVISAFEWVFGLIIDFLEAVRRERRSSLTAGIRRSQPVTAPWNGLSAGRRI